MINKILKFDRIRLQYKKLGKSNTNLFNEYNKGITLTQQIIQDINKQQHKEFKKTKKSILPFDSLLDFYEVKIAENFVAHKELLKSGIVLPSYSHLRTIYEIILMIYLCKTHPDLGELKLKYELIEQCKLSETEQKKIIQNMNAVEWLRVKYIEKKLYSESFQEQLRKFYKNLCEYIHADIKGLATSFEFRPNVFVNSFTLGICLMNCNFVILSELYGNKIKKRYKKKMLKLTEKYYKIIPTGLINLIPENKTDKLQISKHEKFTQFINS